MCFWNTHWPVRINLQESMAIIRTTCVTIHFKSIWMTCHDQADSIRLVDLSKRWLSWKMNPKIDEQIERVIFWNSALYYVNWINESHLAFECIQCRCDLACCWPINVDEFGEQIVYLERKKRQLGNEPYRGDRFHNYISVMPKSPLGSRGTNESAQLPCPMEVMECS